MFPNFDEHKKDDWLVLFREPKSDVMILACQNKDSFQLSQDEIRTWLKLLGVPEELGIVDYVWNFYGARLDLRTMTIEPLTIEQGRILGGVTKEFVF